MLYPKKLLRFILYFLVTLFVTVNFACSSVSPSDKTFQSSIEFTTNSYSENSEYNQLDIYSPRQVKSKPYPIIIYIHGGGFRRGDKSRVHNKPQIFTEKGFMFVSINYRLSPSNAHNMSAKHPAHIQDVAKAIAWVHNNGERFGGNPNQIFLMGHSAGAHLAALVSTDEQYLENYNLDLDTIKGTIAIDTTLYNLVEQHENRPQLARLIENAFGSNLNVLESASPISHLEAGKNIPPFLLTYTNPDSKIANENFAARLERVGFEATLVDSTDKNHAEVNQNIGQYNDKLTEKIFIFLRDILQRSNRETSNTERQQRQRDNLFQFSFTQDYYPGSYDRQSQYMGGTETTYLVNHKGKLWAGIGYWRDEPGSDPSPGPQVLLKTAPEKNWTVDHSWGSDYVRVDSMASITFTTDSKGDTLPQPETILLAGVSQAKGEKLAEVWSRNDNTGEWTRMVVSKDNYVSSARTDKPYIRVLEDHIDQVTGIHYVFAGAAKGAIYRGAYDPTVEGRIQWELQPEYYPGNNRIHSMAVANGVLYAAVGRDNQSNVGGLYRRIDGSNPKWERVYQWSPLIDNPRYKGGMRGLTAIPDPKGDKHEVLLGAREHPGVIELIDPENQHQVTQDFDVRQFFQNLWGNLGGAATIAAYNNMTPVIHPVTGEKALIISLWVNHPEKKNRTELGLSSWYLVRRQSGNYEYGRVFAPENPLPSAPGGLRGTRTIAVSPFPEDKGRVLYFGGYDAGGAGEKHNTAWIYQAKIQ